MARCAPDTFIQFLCSKAETKDFDDAVPAISIQKDLFKRLMLFVYHKNDVGLEDAAALFSKISQHVDANPNQIALTKKDWYYHLLPHIPWTGQRDHNSCYPLLIKDKIVFLKTNANSCIHSQEIIERCNQHENLASALTDTDQITKEFNDLLLTKIG